MTCSCRFLISKKLEQLEFKLEKIRNMQENGFAFSMNLSFYQWVCLRAKPFICTNVSSMLHMKREEIVKFIWEEIPIKTSGFQMSVVRSSNSCLFTFRSRLFQHLNLFCLSGNLRRISIWSHPQIDEPNHCPSTFQPNVES